VHLIVPVELNEYYYVQVYNTKIPFFIFYCYERRLTQISILEHLIVPVESNEYYYLSVMCRLQHIEMKYRLHVCCSIEESVSCLEQRPSTEITPPNINVVTQ